VTDPRWREATVADAVALRDLEKAANLVGLAHVFPAAQFPFPDAEVLDRWVTTLGDPDVTVELAEDAGPVAFVAFDLSGRLRHLAVRPDRWGSGLARSAIDRAVRAIRTQGVIPRLWCLVENQRARSLYEHLGWRMTGREQPAEWPPYPVEQEWVLQESAGGH
jgi:GNAT superfamily N-acetyltransferase